MIKSKRLNNLKTDLSERARALQNSTRALINHHATKRLAPAIAMLLIQCFITLTGAYATPGGGFGSVGDTFFRAFTETYNSWRGPICLFSIVVGFIIMMFAGRHAWHRILIIVAAVIGFALAPEIYNTLNQWGGN